MRLLSRVDAWISGTVLLAIIVCLTVFGRQKSAIASQPLALPSAAAASTPAQDLRVNGKRIVEHLQALSEFGKNPQGGVSRVALQ